jgi:hypothetical protein
MLLASPPVRRWLGSSRIGLYAAALAALLTLPSLGNGLGIDDHLYRARVLGGWDAARSARDLLSFADPDRPDEVRQAMESGELSWWAAPGLRWRFLRPLPALLHHLEFRLGGRGGLGLMHLESVLWMAAVAAAAATLFRRLISPAWVAGLAAVVYAVDDGHGFGVGWLASRCTLMGTFFAIGSLIAHDRWRAKGWRPGAVLAPAALAMALLCAEESVAVAGYLLAYALVLDEAPAGRRARALVPSGLTIAVWYLARRVLGYGTVGPGSYTDAFTDPLAFFAQAAERVPIYVHSQLGALPADLWEVVFVRRGLGWVMVLAGLAFVFLVGAALAPLLRRDRVARFWALGAAIALVPVCGAHPNDRHLFIVGLGGAALVARYLGAWADRRQPEQAPLLPRRGAGVLAGFFLLVHLVLAPIALPIRARIPGDVGRGLARIDARVPRDAGLTAQDLVLVNVPFKYLCNLPSVVRRSNGGPSPAHWRCLGVAPDGVAARREDARTLVLVPVGGYLRHFEDTNVRSPRIPFAPGDQVTLPGFEITVRRITGDGRPEEVAFRFDRPLEDPSLRWLVWRDGSYRPFAPPRMGDTVQLAAATFAWSDLLRPEREPKP